MSDAALTVKSIAEVLGLSLRTVQADVARGCPGIVRPGEVGRGKGALLDLEAYRAWKYGINPVSERAHCWKLLLTATAATFRDYGGVTRQSRARAADALLRLLLRYHASAFGCDLDEVPDEMRSMLRVLQQFGHLPHTEHDDG